MAKPIQYCKVKKKKKKESTHKKRKEKKRKDPDPGKDCRQEDTGTREVNMVVWHHQLNGHDFE